MVYLLSLEIRGYPPETKGYPPGIKGNALLEARGCIPLEIRWCPLKLGGVPWN